MNQTKKTTIIALFLSLLILSGCGKVTEVNNEVDKEEIGKTEEQNNNIATSSEQVEIDTSDWLTYRNEEFGFEVKYPEGWEQRESVSKGEEIVNINISKYFNNNDGFTIGALVKIGIYNNSEKMLNEWAKAFILSSDYDVFDSNQIIINNQNAQYYEYKDNVSGGEIVVIKGDNNVYVIHVRKIIGGEPKDKLQEFNKQVDDIVSSFFIYK